MQRPTGFWLYTVLLSVVLSSALAEDIPVYFRVGGNLELSPRQPEQTAITSIVWKHNGELVAEWVDKESPLTYWGSFNGRTTLDTTTGRLEIRNMSKDDAGLFTVEINNKVQSKSYPARVAKEVVLSSALAQDIPVYFRVGGNLEMRPQQQQTAITSIVWKHNGDPVAEWWDKESPLTYWGSFNGRTTLDTTTGRLEIRNMGKDDAGNFTVEINKVQNESYAAIVVKEEVLRCGLGLDITEYFKVGGSLELRPQPEQTAITSIVWRHNGDLVAEWVDKESPLTYWTVFRDRTTLDTTTGRLEIRNMGKNDTGLFTVEINNKVQSKSYPAKVAKEVSKPTVLVTCNPAVEICLLSCDGDTTETGPVDYYWKFGDREWKQKKKDIITNKTEIQSAETFSCRMKNLVGEKDSDPVENPLIKEPNK